MPQDDNDPDSMPNLVVHFGLAHHADSPLEPRATFPGNVREFLLERQPQPCNNMLRIGPEPPPEDIDEVVKATGCTKTRAKLYLKTNGNDVTKAIKHLKNYQTFTLSPKPKPGDSSRRDSPSSHTLAEPDQKENIDRKDFSDGKNPEEHTGHKIHFVGENSGPSKAEPSEPKAPAPESYTPTTSEGNPEDQQDELPNSDKKSIPDSVAQLTMDIKPPKPEHPNSRDVDSSSWDFRLPKLPILGPLQPGGADGSANFFIRDLAAAVQHGAPIEQIKVYMAHFNYIDPTIIRTEINKDVDGFPAIFYAVAANNDAIIRLFEQAGGDVNAAYGTPAVPLLAFAIINSSIVERETTSGVATLISLGADETVIPSCFYSPFDQDLPVDGPRDEVLEQDLEDERKAWCKASHVRKLLTETFNITQRYHLYRASKLPKPTGRQKDVAARHNSTDLFAVPYFLISQSVATELLTKSFLHYMLCRQSQPLVLVFAGPSGHGKTELARRLGNLLSLDLHVSDCTIVTREAELFGPRKPYVGAEEGSPLNNFLAANNGRKCIVFLDEFEKTTQDIWNALLVPFDNGEYQDRRTLKKVDCKSTIWILATNALDKHIIDFCKRNKAILDEDNKPQREDLLEELTSEMKNEFISVFSPPLTGRISAFVPFLPFSQPETYIGAHKYLLELVNDVRRPINTRPGPDEHLLGNIRLKVRSDASVCKVLTKDYDAALGIRSLKKAVRDRVASCLDAEYLSTHDVITEGLPMEDYAVFVANGKIKVSRVATQQSTT